jgi:hypothetical protein
MLNPETMLQELSRKMLPFLQQHGFSGKIELSILRGGANNRVFLVQDAQHRAVLKYYFQNANDPRDRFCAERAFYEFVRFNGIHRVPEPLAWDAGLRVGLFTFVAGRRLKPNEVDGGRVKRAAEFVAELNRFRQSALVQNIPLGSEACFSIAEHLTCIERRVSRMQAIVTQTETERAAAALVRDQLEPAWRQIRKSIRDRASDKSGWKFDVTLDESERCLSPSDFGFHNAFLAADDQLCFFDFEYAGWDDPAKLICDFFCQPELPVATEHWDLFASTLAESLGADKTLGARARLLFAAYQIKWCCIMLNDFVRVDGARRNFAVGVSEERKAAQVERARQSLQQLGKE